MVLDSSRTPSSSLSWPHVPSCFWAFVHCYFSSILSFSETLIYPLDLSLAVPLLQKPAWTAWPDLVPPLTFQWSLLSLMTATLFTLCCHSLAPLLSPPLYIPPGQGLGLFSASPAPGTMPGT